MEITNGSATIAIHVDGSGNRLVAVPKVEVANFAFKRGKEAFNAGTINISNCRVSNNGFGVQAFTSGATVRLANSDVFNNTTGVNIAAGGIGQRFGNNRIIGNGTDVTGTLTLTGNQ